MKIINRITMCFLIFGTALALHSKCYGQGCSDAGFCTVGGLKPGANEDVNNTRQIFKHRISLISTIGVGDENVFVWTPAIQYDYLIANKFLIQAKLTANNASGNLGSAFAAGDLYLSGTYNIFQKQQGTLQAIAGVKLPLSKSNLEADGKALPMQYQSSLGTVDLIIGSSFTNNGWQIALAWQQPLSGINQNHFLPDYWDKPEADNYPATNDLKRKGDLLFRVGKTFSLNDKISFNAGLLNLLHLGEDEYIDANISNSKIPIEGSDGLTVNITAGFFWQINSKTKLGFNGGFPIATRDVRPDGLTRKFVLAPEISWQF